MGDENRIRSFKNKGKDSEVIHLLNSKNLVVIWDLLQEMRRRRAGQTIELRKAKKEDQLLKRRNISLQEEGSTPLQENNTSPTSMTAEDILWGKTSS